jgi:hypothetical protein
MAVTVSGANSQLHILCCTSPPHNIVPPPHLRLLCLLREWLPHIARHEAEALRCTSHALGLKHAGDVDAAGRQRGQQARYVRKLTTKQQLEKVSSSVGCIPIIYVSGKSVPHSMARHTPNCSCRSCACSTGPLCDQAGRLTQAGLTCR